MCHGDRVSIAQKVTHNIAGITSVTVIAVVGKLVATKLIGVVVSRFG